MMDDIEKIEQEVIDVICYGQDKVHSLMAAGSKKPSDFAVNYSLAARRDIRDKDTRVLEWRAGGSKFEVDVYIREIEE